MRIKVLIILLIASLAYGSARDSTEYLDSQFKNWGLLDAWTNSTGSWKITEGSKKVIVAVIDTGIDSTHKDLKDNLWHDPKTKGVYGWDFVNNLPNPADFHGHGTHVAGIIGAIADLDNGVSGVVHKVSIMSIKYYSDKNTGYVNLRNTIKAIDYAIDHGARIINYSSQGPDFCEYEYLAIKRAEKKGILVVVSAGNDHKDTDIVDNYTYPSAYRLSNIISVAALDINDNLVPSSNWGRAKVDIAAPGENIFSTLPFGHYGYMTGTSMATAFVTGEAALLLAKDPTLTAIQLKYIIMQSVHHLRQLENKTVSEGRIDTYSALLLLKKKRLAKTLEIDENR